MGSGSKFKNKLIMEEKWYSSSEKKQGLPAWNIWYILFCEKITGWNVVPLDIYNNIRIMYVFNCIYCNNFAYIIIIIFIYCMISFRISATRSGTSTQRKRRSSCAWTWGRCQSWRLVFEHYFNLEKLSTRPSNSLQVNKTGRITLGIAGKFWFQGIIDFNNFT